MSIQLVAGEASLETSPPFPASLPQCYLQDGFVYAPAKSTYRFQVAAGMSKIRKRDTKEAWQLSGQIVVDLDQKKLLDSFVKDALRNGSLPFTKPDPIDTRTLYLWRFASPLSYVPYNFHSYLTTLNLQRLPVRGGTVIGSWALVDDADQYLVDDPAQEWLSSPTETISEP